MRRKKEKKKRKGLRKRERERERKKEEEEEVHGAIDGLDHRETRKPLRLTRIVEKVKPAIARRRRGGMRREAKQRGRSTR